MKLAKRFGVEEIKCIVRSDGPESNQALSASAIANIICSSDTTLINSTRALLHGKLGQRFQGCVPGRHCTHKGQVNQSLHICWHALKQISRHTID
jgi:hypothetical protein